MLSYKNLYYSVLFTGRVWLEVKCASLYFTCVCVCVLDSCVCVLVVRLFLFPSLIVIPFCRKKWSLADILIVLLWFISSLTSDWWKDCRWVLTDSLLAGQWALQRHASRWQVWTGAGLKHGWNVERHPVSSEASLNKACEDVSGVVTVVRDATQAGVDGDHH